MSHLTDDQICTLAGKIAGKLPLSPDEETALKHVAECDECYHLLCCMMAMDQVIARSAAYAAPARASVPEVITAVLRLAVDKVSAVLDQIEDGVNAWTFRRAPMALAGTRSGKKRSAARKLTDERSPNTFVAYDPDRQLLVVQVEPAAGGDAPSAFLKLSDGRLTEIPLEKREALYWGEVRGLEEGSYEIILNK